MNIECPHRGQMTEQHPVPRTEYAPVAPQVAGGVGTSLLFALSRKPRCRCDQCGEMFQAHTVSSRIWHSLWLLLLVSLACIGLFLIIGR